MKNSIRIITISWFLVVAVFNALCHAEMYKWVDEKGGMHFTDDPTTIPEKKHAAGVGKAAVPDIKTNGSSQASSKLGSPGSPDFSRGASSTFSLRELLRNRDFNKLNARLAHYQEAYENDVSTEDDLVAAYNAFSIDDPYFEELLNAWVKGFPKDYQPYLARASYFYNLGWKSRGGKWANETSDEQVEGMKRHFSKARQDIAKSLEIRQDLLVPYYLLINIYKTSGTAGVEVKAILNKSLEKCPASFRVKSAYLLSITPRWGGSYEDMERSANEFQKFASKNPRLKILRGYAFYDAGSMQKSSKNYGVALQFLNKALSVGELALFYGERARIYHHLGKYDEALTDISSAIEMSPQEADFYYVRSTILSAKEKMQEALKDVELADRLKPNDENITKQKKRIADAFVYSGHSLEKSKDTQNAIKNYTAAIQVNPNDAYTYYRRARAHIEKNDLSSALNDLEKSVELNPSEFDAYLLLDWVLAKQSDWNSIITYWSKYIALNAENGRAYVERGGAYYRKGDLESAVKDAKRAADLGNVEGKQLYERFKGRVKR